MNNCRARIVMIRQVAETVFKDRSVAGYWLRQANPSFGGVTPLSQLHSSLGAQSVLNELSRIDLAKQDKRYRDNGESGSGRRRAV